VHEITRRKSGFPTVTSATSRNLITSRPRIQKPPDIPKRCGEPLTAHTYIPPLVNLLTPFPCDNRWIFHIQIQRPMFSPLTFLPISPASWSPLSICEIRRFMFTPPCIFPSLPTMRSQPFSSSIQRLAFIPRPSFVPHTVFTFLAYPVHPKEEGGHYPTLCVFNPKQPHSTSSTTREGKYNLEQLNAFNSYVTCSIQHSTGSWSTTEYQKGSFCSLK